MKIGKSITTVVVLLVFLIMAMVYVFISEVKVSDDLEKASAQRSLALQVAGELRQSSDDLTLAARSYVETEDKRYLNYYEQILAIRNGIQERPEDYANVYWDVVFAAHKKPRKDTKKKVSIIELANKAGLTKKEKGYIKESFDRSQNLVLLEQRAFNAVQGRFEDKTGGYGRISIPDQELATSLLFSKEYYKDKADIYEPLSQLHDSIDARTESLVLSLDEKRALLNNTLIILVLLILAVSALLGYLVWKRGRIELAERQAAQEKAELENERLNDSVINILQAVSMLAERDLTARAPVTEDVIGTVSDSINLLADETSNVLHGVTDIAGQVSTVSNDLYEQATQVSKTAKEERESVQRMIETLFDATQTMNQVAALAEQSNESAGQATAVTEGALKTVNETVHGMESIRETISETEKRIKRLGERSQEISSIVNLINTISERTHVLALNASMQAAVAGEAGRGFAVVAEEVQQLAESSRNATEQIATLVNNIQIETNETINTVNRTIGQVVEGSEQAQQAGEQMRKTQEITAELVSRVQNIAQASEQQKSMSAQLLEAVQAIGESTDRTAKQIEAQNVGTVELQKAAKTLVDSVNVFTLPERA